MFGGLNLYPKEFAAAWTWDDRLQWVEFF